MSTFKEIRGTLIKSVSSDPVNPELGEIWYNSTIGSLKGYQTIAAAWASGGNLGTARLEHLGQVVELYHLQEDCLLVQEHKQQV
jgi:hypothetical protein